MLRYVATHLLTAIIAVLTGSYIGYKFAFSEITESIAEKVRADYLMTIEEPLGMGSIYLLVVETDDLRRELSQHLCSRASQLGNTALAFEPDNLELQNRAREGRHKMEIELSRLGWPCS